MLGKEIRCPDCDNMVSIPSQEEIDQARREREAAKQSMAALTKAQQEQQSKPVVRRETVQPVKRAAPKRIDDDELEFTPIERRSMPHDHIDMTPMVDITFLLLIFFMSTANFTLQKSLEVPVQKEQKASKNAVQQVADVQDSVTVQVDEHNAYLVLMPDGTDREASSRQDLILALEDARDVRNAEPPKKLIVEAHRDCTHKAVVAALDAGRQKDFSAFQVKVVDDF